MGRAIDMENKLDAVERRLKLVEDALEELVQNGTRVHHVDLAGDLETTTVGVKGVEIEPDEEFTAPVVTKKKRSRAKATT